MFFDFQCCDRNLKASLIDKTVPVLSSVDNSLLEN